MLASLGSLGGLAGAAAGLKNPADQYIAYMKSNTVQDALIERFKLQERYDEKYKIETRKELEKNSRIASGKDGLISVEFDDQEPQFAADVANAYVEELHHLMGRLAVTEAQQRRLFFEKQVAQAKDNLTVAEQTLKATGISDRVLKSNPASAVAGIAALKAQLTAQEVKIGAMRGYLADSAPDFKQAITELDNLRAQLAKQSKEDNVVQKGEKGDYISRYRDFKYSETLFELLARQYELARVDEAREGAVIQILDKAEIPEKKSAPKKILITILASLITGIVMLIYLIVKSWYKKTRLLRSE